MLIGHLSAIVQLTGLLSFGKLEAGRDLPVPTDVGSSSCIVPVRLRITTILPGEPLGIVQLRHIFSRILFFFSLLLNFGFSLSVRTASCVSGPEVT